MANIISGGSIVTPVTGEKTLSELITIYRARLDDAETPYLWSNDELTEYLNEAIIELCTETSIIEDSTTESICKHILVQDQGSITVSPRVLSVKAARMESESIPMRIMTVHELDLYVNDWRNADSGTPLVFAFDATGDGTAVIYPPTDTAGNLWITVTRLPEYDLSWASDQAVAPDIPSRFVRFLIDGVLYRAYTKQDTDTEAGNRAARHETMWRNNIEKIKRSLIKYRHSDKTILPGNGFM